MSPAQARHLRTLGLKRAPFPPTPDAAAWFQTTQLEAERVEAIHCLRTRAGFVLLTGEVGTGKSTFLRRMLLTLEREGVVTSMVFNTFLQGADLLAAVLRDFGLQPAGSPAADIETLNRFLIGRWRAHATCVLVIDDAQNLTLESLELLRLLTNLETGQEKLLQIVLAGQPELHHNLQQPQIRQLTSRICKHVQLDVLDVEQVARYVHFRLQAAGNPEPGIVLLPEAARALHHASGGNPRRIHQIMDRSLYGLYGRDATARRIDAALIRTAAAEAGTRPLQRRRRRLPLAVAAAAASVLTLSVLLLALPGTASRADDGRAALAASAAAPAVPAPTADAAWNACLQQLGPGTLHLQTASEAWLARLPTREGLCLRRQPDGWQAGWRTQLRAEDFLAAANTAQGRDRLLALQTLLHDAGDYDGALDGRYGPRMHAAIARLQQRHGLPASGAPDPATLFLFDTLLAARAVASPPSPDTHPNGNG